MIVNYFDPNTNSYRLMFLLISSMVFVIDVSKIVRSFRDVVHRALRLKAWLSVLCCSQFQGMREFLYRTTSTLC